MPSASFHSGIGLPLSEVYLKSIVFSFKMTNCTGIDGIYVIELLRSYSNIIDVLLSIIYGIIDSGQIPVKLKTVTLIPLYKS